MNIFHYIILLTNYYSLGTLIHKIITYLCVGSGRKDIVCASVCSIVVSYPFHPVYFMLPSATLPATGRLRFMPLYTDDAWRLCPSTALAQPSVAALPARENRSG